MVDEDRYLASLMQRHHIAQDIYLYTYICTVVGNNDLEYNYFIDEQGNEYPNIDSSEDLLDNYPYVCAGHLTVEDAYEIYHFEEVDDFQEVLDSYAEENQNYMYMAFLNMAGEKQFLTFNLNKLETMANNSLIHFTEENIETYINNVNNNVYSIDELKFLQFNLLKNSNDVVKLLKLIRSKLNGNEKDIQQTEKEELKKEKGKESKKKREYINNTGIINVNKMVNDIKKTIIAQDDPIRKLVVEMTRLNMNDNKNQGILLSGSPYVGRTELLRLVSEKLDRPFLIIDSTKLPVTGGKTIEQYLWELYKKCDGDLRKVENAIVYFEEIDNKSFRLKDDIYGTRILNQYLNFLDGTTYSVSENTDNKDKIKINTSNMTSVFGGEFTDVFSSSKQIGFKMQEDNYNNIPPMNEFVKKGMMTYEFMSRLPVIIRMNDLNAKDLKEILKISDKSPIKNQIETFNNLGVKLNFTENAYNYIAENAYKIKQGALGLKNIVSNVTYQPFDLILSNMGKIEEITIEKETIDNNKKYKVKYKTR